MPPSDSFAPWDVYAGELERLGYGHPLWCPEPTKFGEVKIGDVGFICEGAFYRLFNAMHDASDPVNSGGVPEGFTKLTVDDRLRHRTPSCLSKGPICSKSTKSINVKAEVGALSVAPVQAGGGYAFEVEGNTGAVVILNGDGVEEKILPGCIAMREYILTHHASWVEFVRSNLGLSAKPQDIVLVSGWIKTTEWALSAYSREDRSHALSFSIAAGGYTSLECSFNVQSSANVHMQGRLGPRSEAAKNSAQSAMHPDQCLFLRYYKCHRPIPGVRAVVEPGKTSGRWHVLPGSSKYGPTSPSNEIRGTVDEMPNNKVRELHIPVRSQFSHHLPTSKQPQRGSLDYILRYIAKNKPGLDAVVCHDDLNSLFNDFRSCSEDITFPDYVEKICPEIIVEPYGARLSDSPRNNSSDRAPTSLVRRDQEEEHGVLVHSLATAYDIDHVAALNNTSETASVADEVCQPLDFVAETRPESHPAKIINSSLNVSSDRKGPWSRIGIPSLEQSQSQDTAYPSSSAEGSLTAGTSLNNQTSSSAIFGQPSTKPRNTAHTVHTQSRSAGTAGSYSVRTGGNALAWNTTRQHDIESRTHHHVPSSRSFGVSWRSERGNWGF